MHATDVPVEGYTEGRTVRFATLTWEFPVLVKYRVRLPKAKPFLELGPAFRAIGNLEITLPSHYGITGGAGVEFGRGRFKVSPTIRYTRHRMTLPEMWMPHTRSGMSRTAAGCFLLVQSLIVRPASRPPADVCLGLLWLDETGSGGPARTRTSAVPDRLFLEISDAALIFTSSHADKVIGGEPMLADRTPCSQLAALRQAKGITLEDISSSTRIGRHFLEAIEAEEFKKLPGGVYNVNYLRQYARISGCDEQALLRRYHDQVDVHPAPEPPNRIPRYLEPLRSVFGRLSDGRADGRADSRSDRRAARNHA